jgi:predicted aldo/keto reductase-like oxidoreductase
MTWREGLPHWKDTPGGINLSVLLWLHNLIEAWDLESYATARYGILGHAGHWAPGANADASGSGGERDRSPGCFEPKPLG